MKGFLLIIVIYAVSLCICAVVKLVINSNFLIKKGGDTSPPKIYYVTKHRHRKEKQGVIPIKASVIEKEDIEN